MSRYLPKDTCEYLASLGCLSDSRFYYIVDDEYEGSISLQYTPGGPENGMDIPAFDLADILRKENAEKIVQALRHGTAWWTFGYLVLGEFWNYPDTWTDEVSKLINPTKGT